MTVEELEAVARSLEAAREDGSEPFGRATLDLASEARSKEVAKENEALVRNLRASLAFREACDAAHVEGVQARIIGAELDANPYVGDEPAERICPSRPRKDFQVPWMIGWRMADERAALDALVEAAQASTRDGTVTPACPAGEALREAVAAYLARRVQR